MMLESYLGDYMGRGLFRKETYLPNLVTGSVTVLMVRNNRRKKKWLRDIEGHQRLTDSTQ